MKFQKKSIYLIVTIAIISMISCQNKYKFPFQDPALSIEKRVDDLVSRMTLEEKIGQVVSDADSVSRLGIPKYNWWNECLHGVARAGNATVFPQSIGMAATWDTALIHKLGNAISDEARAKHHNYKNQEQFRFFRGLLSGVPILISFAIPVGEEVWKPMARTRF
ncbi:beta-glucosidase [Aquipluma nitroreducens]|uniref:Beta-glucosidase n=1 Tax=Aquipluma nitroreducens TaxID=2010828 RepID=A0A5K7SFN6_9BACT|nr:glycoside hydrolase family 3 N-terminal domain-containing protein [Aquipluma nitroreducens]BBE20401.1 beta-glucosidase [Aquipluma nitroreducens]